MRTALLLALALVVPTCGWTQAVKRPPITGIAFARFYTTDPEAAKTFYGTTLGLARKDVEGEWIFPVNHSQWIEITPAKPPQENARMAAVAFTTRDAAGLETYLADHHVKAEQPLSRGEFSVRDPEGNLVIFVQSGSNTLVAGSAPSPKATSRRLVHVGFKVNDEAKEDAFWTGILGFKPNWHGGHTDAVTDWSSLQVPEGSDWLEYMLNAPTKPDLRQSGGMDHLSLGVEHMGEAIAALERNQCVGAICTSSRMGRDGKVQLNLFDPDLTRVEFMEFAPTRKPCCSPIVGKLPSSEEEQ